MQKNSATAACFCSSQVLVAAQWCPAQLRAVNASDVLPCLGAKTYYVQEPDLLPRPGELLELLQRGPAGLRDPLAPLGVFLALIAHAMRGAGSADIVSCVMVRPQCMTYLEGRVAA